MKAHGFTHSRFVFLLSVGLVPWLIVSGCKPDESPLKDENARLQSRLEKQESIIASLQEGNKVMQEQINLLNKELRDAEQSTEATVAETQEDLNHLKSERKTLLGKIDRVQAQNRALAQEREQLLAKGAAVQKALRVTEEGGQTAELSESLPVAAKGVEDALGRNGYALLASMKTDQKAVYVTHRKISQAASLELSGFRNQYVISLQAIDTGKTRLRVKADFEKIAQQQRILEASEEEISEIERRLITAIRQALETKGKA